MTKRTNVTVSFRADENLTRLIDEARSLFGVSRGHWVRGVVIGHLHRADPTEFNDQFVELRQTLQELCEESQRAQARFRRLSFALLTLVADITSAEAKAIVEKIFHN
jgi:hypothetical protein